LILRDALERLPERQVKAWQEKKGACRGEAAGRSWLTTMKKLMQPICMVY
jgi:hypothetical protein